MTTTAPKHRIRLDIQGLRALAVVLVILAHTFDIPSGGYVGVDVFFVISGFVITGLLLREHERDGRISLGGFYVRRVRRIAPAALIVISCTLIAGFVLLSSERFRSLWWDAVSSAFFVANWRMAGTGTDYFQQGLPPSALQHYWSLSVEEQFYLIWPAALIAVFTLARSRRARAISLSALMTVTIGASLIWGVVQTAGDPNFAYFSSLTRFWELGVGAALACLTPVLERLPGRVRPVLLYLGIALILGSAILLSSASPFPGWLATIPVSGAALAIAAGTGADPRYDRIAIPLTNPVAKHLGDHSYSLYLWHFPLVVLAPALFPASVWLDLAIVVATWLLSVATYCLVENPIRRSDWLTPRGTGNRTGVIAGVAIVTASAVVLAMSALFIKFGPDETAAGDTEAAATTEECLGAAAAQTGADCPPAQTVAPSLDSLQNDTGGAYSADCWRDENGEARSCTFGSEAEDATRVALIGDSHAAMYIPALREIAPELGWQVTTYVGWGCQWIDQPDQPCSEQTALAEQGVEGGEFDMVLTASSRKATGQLSDDVLETSSEMWRRAAADGVRILALESVPIPSEDSLLCIQRVGFDPASDDCSTPLDEATAEPDEVAELAQSTESAVPGSATLVPTSDLICSDDSCPAVAGGVVTYRDADGHLTASYLATMRTYLRDRIAAALG